MRSLLSSRSAVALVLVVTCAGAAAALALAATPAHAFDEWQHDGASGCDWCHPRPDNSTCTFCHRGFLVVAGMQCWSCHAPGQDTAPMSTSAGCVSQCHLWDAPAKQYLIAFAHEPVPHLGAEYAFCTDCHGVAQGWADPDRSPHHDGVVQGPPTCEECHNGVYASAQTSHDGEPCEACHTGMNRPWVTPSFCLGCHDSADHPEATQISYTNTLDCTTAACHGTSVIHAKDPAMTSTCTDCHAAHYQSLGTCTTCHSDVEGYHHGQAQAIPLNDCQACHDGGIASKVANHNTVTPVCTACHAGMNIPAQPEACNPCHNASTFDGGRCTSCHSTTGVFGQEQVHTTKPNAHTCTKCHVGYQKHAGAAACKTCHRQATTFHHGLATSPGLKRCADCHAMKHAGRSVSTSKCATCHRGAYPKSRPRVYHSATVKKLSKCGACHTQKLHARAYTSSTSCRSCHTAKFHGSQPHPKSSTCLKCHSRAKYHYVGYPCVLCHRGSVHDPTPVAGGLR